MRKTLLALVASTLLVPSPAEAKLVDPTPRQAAAISVALTEAHRHWQTDVCAGQWKVRYDTTLAARGRDGEASGLTVYDDGSWKISACEFTMAPSVTGCLLELTVIHEVGHFIHGPSMDPATHVHHGPLAESILNALPCSAATEKIERHNEALERIKRKRVKNRWLAKRERGKIARSTGYWR